MLGIVDVLQVFGDGEEINGYRGLQVDVWLSAHSFHCW
jgi:hypothetical protein